MLNVLGPSFRPHILVVDKSRHIPIQPEIVLDVPGMIDDFFCLYLVFISSVGYVRTQLGWPSTYICKDDTGAVIQLDEFPQGSYVSSVDFSRNGAFLEAGNDTGDFELCNVETGQKLRKMENCFSSWHQHILTSGCYGIASSYRRGLVHVEKRWRANKSFLRAAVNDNVVNIWEGAKWRAKWTKRNHSVAIKVSLSCYRTIVLSSRLQAIAWCCVVFQNQKMAFAADYQCNYILYQFLYPPPRC